MRILEQIIIENFQCHPKTVINVAPTGLTIITGPTDHGKSAMVRAIKWLTTNRPQGDDFIRHGQTECKVTFIYTDGVTVQRRRTTSLNQYYVNDDLYEGFGNSVPLEVQKATGVYTYVVADQTFYLNISEQLAGPFLGSSISAPLRAKILGKWAGTEDVDRANSKLKTDIYHAKRDKSMYEDHIATLDEDIKGYNWVKPLGVKLEKLEQIRDKVGKQTDKLELLRQKKEQLGNVSEQIAQQENQLKWYYDVLPDVFQIISSIEPDIPLLVDLIMKDNKLFDIETKITAEKLTIQDCGDPEEAKKRLTEVDVSAHNLIQIHGLSGGLLNVNHSIQYNETQIIKSGNPTEALKILNNCNNHINKYNTLHRKTSDYESFKNRINIQTHIYESKYQGIDEAKKLIEKTRDKNMELQELNKTVNQHESLTFMLGYHETIIPGQKMTINNLTDEIRQAKSDYKLLLKDSGVCPYCGSKVHDECLDHVV